MIEIQTLPPHIPESVLAPDVRHLSQGVGSYDDYQRLRATAAQITWGGEDGGRFNGPDGVRLETEDARGVLNTADHPERLILGEDDTGRLLNYASRLGGINNQADLTDINRGAFNRAVEEAKKWGVHHPETLTPDELSGVMARRVSLSERILQERPRPVRSVPAELESGELVQGALRGVGDTAVDSAVAKMPAPAPPAPQPLEKRRPTPKAERPSRPAPTERAQEPEAAAPQEYPPAFANADTEEFTPEMVAVLKTRLDEKTYKELGLAVYEGVIPALPKGISLFDGAEIDYDRIANIARAAERAATWEARRARMGAFFRRRWNNARSAYQTLKNMPADLIGNATYISSLEAAKAPAPTPVDVVPPQLIEQGASASVETSPEVPAGLAPSTIIISGLQHSRRAPLPRETHADLPIVAAAGAGAAYLAWLRDGYKKK